MTYFLLFPLQCSISCREPSLETSRTKHEQNSIAQSIKKKPYTVVKTENQLYKWQYPKAQPRSIQFRFWVTKGSLYPTSQTGLVAFVKITQIDLWQETNQQPPTPSFTAIPRHITDLRLSFQKI